MQAKKASFTGRLGAWLPGCLWIALLALMPCIAWAQGVEACGPSPGIKAALDQLPSYASSTQTYWQYR